MKAGVITFPGSNCDDDLVYALSRCAGFDVVPLWHKDKSSLGDFSLIALPGGFSFGDYLRCGAVASLSPVMESVKEFADRGGLVFGLCNGFQILCESGLLPGALARNESLQFVCKDITLNVESTDSPWTRAMRAGDKLQIPIAHGDGRYVVDEAEYAKLKQNGQILFTYSGGNPNGSVHDIAGVCNSRKNVFGTMPHPERASDLRSRDGMKFWQSLRQTLERAR
jgi:phosphoribosylformylglycinamidine synthase subunit PurQ / glutaminase